MTAAIAQAPDQWARQFADEGYFVVESAVAGALLDGLRADADRAVAEERGRLQRGEELQVPVSRLDDRYVIAGFVRRSACMRELVFSELMASICRAALGADAYFYSETFVCKAPHNEHGWIWHQDSSYLDYVGCGHYPPNLSVWVALDEMTASNGSLRVLPFSVLDVRRVVPHDFTHPWTSDDVVDFGGRDGLLLTVPAGSMVVMDGALPHASDTNRSDRPRRAILIQYSRQPVLKDGKPVQLAVPFVQAGVRRVPSPDEIR
ncbi:MAG: phytanoyl-CoA dioxygenase family protein [Candidatus Binatia bacterium]